MDVLDGEIKGELRRAFRRCVQRDVARRDQRRVQQHILAVDTGANVHIGITLQTQQRVRAPAAQAQPIQGERRECPPDAPPCMGFLRFAE